MVFCQSFDRIMSKFIARNTMTRIQAPLDQRLLSPCESVCITQVYSCTDKVVLRYFAPTSSISFLLPYLLFFLQKSGSSRSTGTHPQRKAVQVSDPATGLCRKILSFAVGGILSTSRFSSVGIHFASHLYKCSPHHEEAGRSISKQKSFRNTPKKSSKLEKIGQTFFLPQQPSAGQGMFVSLRSPVLSPLQSLYQTEE